MTDLKHTPFYDFHVKSGAKMVDFAGWEMPLLYRGIIPEHEHTRTAVSVFDVSHMGRLKISGKDATAFLQHVCTRNLEKSVVGQSLYSLVCNAAGGILDDVIVSRYADHWLMVCNAGNREKLLGCFQMFLAESAGHQVAIADETFKSAMLAVQGPKAVETINAVLPHPIADLKRYHFVSQRYMMMIQFTIFRSGYTGEDGVEIIAGNSAAQMAVNMLMRETTEHALIKPAGLGARDTLRLEAGMPLYGHELSEQTDPLSAGLGQFVDLSKDFIGAAALREIQSAGPKQKLVGLTIEGPRAARQGMTIQLNGANVGTITSGATSPTLKRCIAMGYVDAQFAAPGTALAVDLRGAQVPAAVTPLPFYKRPK